MNFTCPVCFFDGLRRMPREYAICPCCGTEFGNHDEFTSHEELRERWIQAGTPWFFRNSPIGWNPILQLIRGNMPVLPRVSIVADARNVVAARIDLRNTPSSRDYGVRRQEFELVAV
jgi:hypothetical protein